MALVKVNFESQFLHNNTEISIILPDVIMRPHRVIEFPR